MSSDPKKLNHQNLAKDIWVGLNIATAVVITIAVLTAFSL